MADQVEQTPAPDEAKPAEDPKKDSGGKEPEDLNEKIAKALKSRAETAKTDRRQLSNNWKRNVELRMGKIADTFTGGVMIEDDIQTEINPDWSLTKAKTANLFSQVPTIQGSHENKAYAAAVGPFMKALNFELGEKRANIGTSMEEVLNDVVNAAGIGAIVMGYSARFEEVEMPVNDVKMLPPAIVAAGIKMGLIKTKKVKRPTSSRFTATRISPTDLLVPSEFKGSNFDDGDWVGYSGVMAWGEAKHEFDLQDEVKEKVVSGGTEKATEDDLRSNPTKSSANTVPVENVKYDRLYYWRHRVDPDEPYFEAIWEIVYVKGMEKPAVHRAWPGQKLVDEAPPKPPQPAQPGAPAPPPPPQPAGPAKKHYIGSMKFPVRILTLTYITDNPIPPSDSEAGRPQVNDLRRSRSQMFQNRRHSMPVRWADVNRVDSLVLDNLMRGKMQGIIPTNGAGDKVIGEVARASYPAEDLSFDQTTKQDLTELWQLGPGSGMPAQGRQTSASANINQQNFATRIGQERTRTAKMFLSCAEVAAGYMVLYSDFPSLTPEEKQAMQQAWDFKHVAHDLALKIRPDSTIMIDSQQRVERLFKFLNMTVKSGMVNPLPIITEICELNDLDPNEVIAQPKPKAPDEPNISFRFSGKDDLQNPAVVAMLMKHKQFATPEEINAAKKALMAIQDPNIQPDQPQGGQPGPGGPAPNQVDTHKGWSLGDRIAKRSRDVSGG